MKWIGDAEMKPIFGKFGWICGYGVPCLKIMPGSGEKSLLQKKG